MEREMSTARSGVDLPARFNISVLGSQRFLELKQEALDTRTKKRYSPRAPRFIHTTAR